MKLLTALAALGLLTALPAHAGDPVAGERAWNQCRACHMIVDGDNVIQRGPATGPNLYGIVGRPAGAQEDFRYGTGLTTAAEKGLVWTPENLARYLENPAGFLTEFNGARAQSNMAFRLRRGADDLVAYLESVAN